MTGVKTSLVTRHRTVFLENETWRLAFGRMKHGINDNDHGHDVLRVIVRVLTLFHAKFRWVSRIEDDELSNKLISINGMVLLLPQK